MTQTLTLLTANTMLVAVFLVTTCLVHRFIVRRPMLLWAMAALATGGIDVVLTVATDMQVPAYAAAGIFLDIASSICVAKIAMIYRGMPGLLPLTAFPAIALGMAGAVAGFAGFGYLGGALPLQGAAALPLLEAGWLFWSVPSANLRERALAVIFTTGAINFLLRIPFFILHLEPDATRAEVLATPVMIISMYVVTLLIPLAMFLLLSLVVGDLMADYKMRSDFDGLTGIANRRRFEETYGPASEAGGVLIVADLDRFKQINDRHGHAVGDDAIRAFTSLLVETRVNCGRIGGEEFAIYLPAADLRTGRLVAEGLRTAFSLRRIPVGTGTVTMTASFGITSCEAGEPLHRCMARADAALYRAKRSGRNRVAIHDAGPMSGAVWRNSA